MTSKNNQQQDKRNTKNFTPAVSGWTRGKASQSYTQIVQSLSVTDRSLLEGRQGGQSFPLFNQIVGSAAAKNDPKKKITSSKKNEVFIPVGRGAITKSKLQQGAKDKTISETISSKTQPSELIAIGKGAIPRSSLQNTKQPANQSTQVPPISGSSLSMGINKGTLQSNVSTSEYKDKNPAQEKNDEDILRDCSQIKQLRKDAYIGVPRSAHSTNNINRGRQQECFRHNDRIVQTKEAKTFIQQNKNMKVEEKKETLENQLNYYLDTGQLDAAAVLVAEINGAKHSTDFGDNLLKGGFDLGLAVFNLVHLDAKLTSENQIYKNVNFLPFKNPVLDSVKKKLYESGALTQILQDGIQYSKSMASDQNIEVSSLLMQRENFLVGTGMILANPRILSSAIAQSLPSSLVGGAIGKGTTFALGRVGLNPLISSMAGGAFGAGTENYLSNFAATVHSEQNRLKTNDLNLVLEEANKKLLLESTIAALFGALPVDHAFNRLFSNAKTSVGKDTFQYITQSSLGLTENLIKTKINKDRDGVKFTKNDFGIVAGNSFLNLNAQANKILVGGSFQFAHYQLQQHQRQQFIFSANLLKDNEIRKNYPIVFERKTAQESNGKYVSLPTHDQFFQGKKGRELAEKVVPGGYAALLRARELNQEINIPLAKYLTYMPEHAEQNIKNIRLNNGLTEFEIESKVQEFQKDVRKFVVNLPKHEQQTKELLNQVEQYKAIGINPHNAQQRVIMDNEIRNTIKKTYNISDEVPVQLHGIDRLNTIAPPDLNYGFKNFVHTSFQDHFNVLSGLAQHPDAPAALKHDYQRLNRVIDSLQGNNSADQNKNRQVIFADMLNKYIEAGEIADRQLLPLFQNAEESHLNQYRAWRGSMLTDRNKLLKHIKQKDQQYLVYQVTRQIADKNQAFYLSANDIDQKGVHAELMRQHQAEVFDATQKQIYATLQKHPELAKFEFSRAKQQVLLQQSRKAVNESAIYKVQHLLRTGRNLSDNTKRTDLIQKDTPPAETNYRQKKDKYDNHKLNKEALIEEFGNKYVNKLPQYLIKQQGGGGQLAKDIAKEYGFKNPKQMLDMLIDAPDKEIVAKALAERTMAEKNWSQQQKLMEVAQDAWHNPAQDAAILVEIRTLQELAGIKNDQFGFGWPDKYDKATDYMKIHIDNQAENVLGQLVVGGFQPQSFYQAEIASAKKAKEAFKNNDYKTAYEAKIAQAINSNLYQATKEGKKEIGIRINYIEKLINDKEKHKIIKANSKEDFLLQIFALAADYGFKINHRDQLIDTRKQALPLNQFASKLEAQNKNIKKNSKKTTIEVPSSLLLRKRPVSYEHLTPAELDDIVAVIAQMEKRATKSPKTKQTKQQKNQSESLYYRKKLKTKRPGSQRPFPRRKRKKDELPRREKVAKRNR